jgi:hypothetical protein
MLLPGTVGNPAPGFALLGKRVNNPAPLAEIHLSRLPQRLKEGPHNVLRKTGRSRQGSAPGKLVPLSAPPLSGPFPLPVRCSPWHDVQADREEGSCPPPIAEAHEQGCYGEACSRRGPIRGPSRRGCASIWENHAVRSGEGDRVRVEIVPVVFEVFPDEFVDENRFRGHFPTPTFEHNCSSAPASHSKCCARNLNPPFSTLASVRLPRRGS